MSKKKKSSNAVPFKSKKSIRDWEDYFQDPNGREPEFSSKNQEIKFLRKKIDFLDEALFILMNDVSRHTNYFDQKDIAIQAESEVDALMKGEYKPPEDPLISPEDEEDFSVYMEKMGPVLAEVCDVCEKEGVHPVDLADFIIFLADTNDLYEDDDFPDDF